MTIRKVILGDKQTADAVYMALENAWENARDDSEYERKDAIDYAMHVLDRLSRRDPYPLVIPVSGAMGTELLMACEQVSEEPEGYIDGMTTAAIAYDEKGE